MHNTYQGKSDSLQKRTASNASSVFDSSSQCESLQRKADMANNAAQRAEAPRPNNTGMPDNLKAGIESLSGFSMDNVRVHYNSSKPATVQALAYTQGTDIHVAPGQEKCLPHEAWHVAQQMAGRVSPTTNINGMPVNDNAALEHEADVMGEKAVQCKISTEKNIVSKGVRNCCSLQLLTVAQKGRISKYVLDKKFIDDHFLLGAGQADVKAKYEERAAKKPNIPAESAITASVDEFGRARKMDSSKMIESIQDKAYSAIKNDSNGDKAKAYTYKGKPQVLVKVTKLNVRGANAEGKMTTKDEAYIGGDVDIEENLAHGHHFAANHAAIIDNPLAW